MQHKKDFHHRDLNVCDFVHLKVGITFDREIGAYVQEGKKVPYMGQPLYILRILAFLLF